MKIPALFAMLALVLTPHPIARATLDPALPSEVTDAPSLDSFEVDEKGDLETSPSTDEFPAPVPDPLVGEDADAHATDEIDESAMVEPEVGGPEESEETSVYSELFDDNSSETTEDGIALNLQPLLGDINGVTMPRACRVASRPSNMPRATNKIGEASGDNSADLWMIDGEGHLRFYTGTVRGELRGGKDILCDAGHITSINPISDVNGDQRADLLVRETDGHVYYYYSLGAGFLEKGSRAGNNWADMDSIQYAGKLGGNSEEYLIGRKISTGELYRYNITRGALTNTTRIGTGWSGMAYILSPGQFVGSLHEDLIGIRKDGLMFAYAGFGQGRVTNVGQVGQGWTRFHTALIPGDINGDGTRDLVGVRDDGGLFIYKNTMKGWWGKPVHDGYFYDDRPALALSSRKTNFAFSGDRLRPDILRQPQTSGGITKTLMHGEHVYHPVGTLNDVTLALDAPEITGEAEQEYLDYAKRHLDYLVRGSTMTNTGRWFTYGFNHGNPALVYLKAPWVSGMAQGMALSAFSRYYYLTGDETYAQYAHDVFSTFSTRFGETYWFANYTTCASGRGSCLYLEEYPSNVESKNAHVVNGHIYSLMGLYDYYKVFGNRDALEMFGEAVRSTRDSFGAFRMEGGPSWYAMTDVGYAMWWRPKSYHHGVTYQLRLLGSITGDPVLLTQGDILERDCSPVSCR